MRRWIIAMGVLASCGGPSRARVVTTGSAAEQAPAAMAHVCTPLFDGIQVAIPAAFRTLQRFKSGFSFTTTAGGKVVTVRIDLVGKQCTPAPGTPPPLDPAFPPRYFVGEQLNATRTTGGLLVSDEGCISGSRRALIATVYEYPPELKEAITQILAGVAAMTDGIPSPGCPAR